ncbi:hypothetical protein RhiirA4_485170 [Rhizophagus irregularis]|uniref:Uncharacterized protein n=1 Tax=Rhizophagus irregularis TaxID=588596 RepID=A0A2I1HPU4_9GLOM|nr:hypothetical protein RhiirA4_485170 [Rhizophagus irregularis]
MTFNNNNQPQVDYLLVKQLIIKFRDSSFLNTLRQCCLRVGLSEYNADNLGEKDIVDTIKHTAGDDFAPYENLLSEFRGVFSTFGMKNLTKLYHFLYIALMCSQHFQLLFGQRVDDLYDSLQIVAQIESEVDQQMETEFSIPVSPTTFKADAEPFTPKGKGRKNDTSRPSSPSPTMDKKKQKTAPVSKTTSHKTPKKQHATPAFKTISTVMTGYDPEFKENIHEITVYDIPFRWTQLDILNHLKTWGQNSRAWTAPLGDIPVRWFPANWDLKQRKERERFQAVLIGVPTTTNIATLYPDNSAHSILTPTRCKAFKLIQDRAPAN